MNDGIQVKNLRKNKLTLFPFFLGLGFLLYAWFSSYPLLIEFAGDVIFNHISPFYWLGMSLMLSSLFLLGVFSKSHYLKCATCIGTVLIIFSLSFFFFSLPSSDSTYFRGLNEYFMETKNLDPSQSSHLYYQWPAFFLIGDLTTTVSGLNLINAEFLLYSILGSLLAITLYVYASRLFKHGGFLAVTTFFILMFYFLNFQWVPYTLGFALVLVLFMLETRRKTPSVLVTMMILFLVISLTHIFVALFFIFYLFIQSFVTREKQYKTQFLLTLITYLIVQFSAYWIEFNILNIFRLPSEYSNIIQYSLDSVIYPIDAVAQNMSRTVTIAVGLVSLVGFILVLIRRKLRSIDKSLFLAGIFYTVLGSIFFLLGNRAISLFSIPLSLGVSYLFETKIRTYLKGLFLILILLFVSVPIHASFNSYIGSFVPFQTKQEYVAENFLLDSYNWTTSSVVISHSSVEVYLRSRLDTSQTEVKLENDFWFDFPRIKRYDCILFTIGIVNNFLLHNYSVEKILSEEKFNVIYDNGFSQIAIKS